MERIEHSMHRGQENSIGTVFYRTQGCTLMQHRRVKVHLALNNRKRAHALVANLGYHSQSDFTQERFVCLLVGCLTSLQQASVSQGRICSDNFTCCHAEVEVADQTLYLTQSQYTDTGPTSPSAVPITPGAWQGNHWSANFEVTGMTQPRKKSWRKRDSNPGPSALEEDAFPLGQRGGSQERRSLFATQHASRHSGQ